MLIKYLTDKSTEHDINFKNTPLHNELNLLIICMSEEFLFIDLLINKHIGERGVPACKGENNETSLIPSLSGQPFSQSGEASFIGQMGLTALLGSATPTSIPASILDFLRSISDTCRCCSCIYGQKWNQYHQLLNKLYNITAAGATRPSGLLSRAPCVHLCQWSNSYLVNTNQLQQNTAIPLAESPNLIFFFSGAVGTSVLAMSREERRGSEGRDEPV